MDADLEKLRKSKFKMTFYKTIVNNEGNKIDMYLLNDDKTGEGLISFGVPHGNETAAKFLVKCCNAGVKVLNTFDIKNMNRFNP